MRRPRLPSSKSTLSHRLVVLDIVVAFLAPIVAFWLRDAPVLSRVDPAPIVIYVGAATCLSILFFVQFHVAHGLPKFFSFHDAIQITKASASTVTATAIIIFTFTRLEEIPRSIPAIHFLILTAGLIGARLMRRMMAQRHELGAAMEVAHDKERSVIVVGAGRLAWFYIRLLDSFAAGNRRIAAILDDDIALHGRSIFGHVIMGGTQEAAALLEDFAQHGIDVIGFVICERDRDRALELFERLKPLCRDRGLELQLLAEQLGIYSSEPQEDVRDRPQASEATPGDGYFRKKRVIESAIAAILLLVLSPLFLLTALLVLIGLGSPVIFWQRRIGRDGRPICIYKFRTLRNPIDEKGRRLNDNERALLIGRLLCATRLDELPQLFNVVKGDMTLIGPRPLLLVDQPQGETLRLSVAPGLTGWAQIHGGKLVSVEEKNALDEWYVRNASLRLDLEILFRTILIVLTGDRRNENRLAAALAQAAEDKKASGSSPRNERQNYVMLEERRAPRHAL